MSYLHTPGIKATHPSELLVLGAALELHDGAGAGAWSGAPVWAGAPGAGACAGGVGAGAGAWSGAPVWAGAPVVLGPVLVV